MRWLGDFVHMEDDDLAKSFLDMTSMDGQQKQRRSSNQWKD